MTNDILTELGFGDITTLQTPNASRFPVIPNAERATGDGVSEQIRES
jgi:hypothetical protein